VTVGRMMTVNVGVGVLVPVTISIAVYDSVAVGVWVGSDPGVKEGVNVYVRKIGRRGEFEGWRKMFESAAKKDPEPPGIAPAITVQPIPVAAAKSHAIRLYDFLRIMPSLMEIALF
jgi:hypothetical protein